MAGGKITRIVGGTNSIECETWTVYTNNFTAYAGKGSHFTADGGTTIGEPKDSPEALGIDNSFVPIVLIDESDNELYSVSEEQNMTWTLDNPIDEDKRKTKSMLIKLKSKAKTKIKFNVKKGYVNANDNDGGIIKAFYFKKGDQKSGISTEHKVSGYDTTIELELSKEQGYDHIQFYADDNDSFFNGGVENVYCGAVKIYSPRCYCLEMGLTTKHCGGEGATAKKENYKVLAEELQAEEAAVYAVSKQESSGGGFMKYDGKKVAKILYERHYMYNNLVEAKGGSFANGQMNKNNYLVNSVSGKYVYNSKGEKEVNENIASREKLSLSRKIDESSALKSCSWGAFQIMGQFYSRLYESPQDLEKAQDMCELQQIAYFKAYLLKERIPALKALRNKNWEEFTFYYNGKDWKRNNGHYPVNMKKYYEEYKK